MQANATQKNHRNQMHKANSHLGTNYQKVKDPANRKPIRGLWVRNRRYYAQLRLKDPATGITTRRRVPLRDADGRPARTIAQARDLHNALKVDAERDVLPIQRRTPKFGSYADEYLRRYEEELKDAKRPGTVEKERSCLKQWRKWFGDLRLDNISKPMITQAMGKLGSAGLSNRTINIYVIVLRNVLKRAIDDGWLVRLPTENLRPLKHVSPRRPLASASEIESLCAAGFERPLKNAQELSDYIKLMAYSGGRRDETLRLKWDDVDSEREQLTFGADGLSKNREARSVDFNPRLKAHLLDLEQRRAPDTDFLFPSPRRGEKDKRAKTFQESLKLARAAAGLPRFTFHDCRHFFISMCIMSGIDYMTIARWVGHRDGGILIGKVYGHLADAHVKAQAQKLNFEPVIVAPAQKA